MDKNYIYDNFILIAEQQNKFLEQSININKTLQAFLCGCKDSENNSKKNMPLISKGEEIMKFKGKTIFKNKNCNTYYTRYRIDGKQYYISGSSQTAVLKELKERLNYIPKEKKKYISLLDWYKQWLKLFKSGNKQSTIDVYNSLLKHIGEEILNQDIKKINKMDILNMINRIPGERTRQKTYEFLMDLYNKAEKYEVSKNIMNSIEKPKHKRKNGIAFTKDDENRFIKYCLENKDYIYLITLYQGMRKGEVMALTGTDINLENNTITINKAINDNNEIDKTKEEVSNRITPIFKNTQEILKRIKLTANERLFNENYTTIYTRFKKIINILELNSNYTMHSLRHTFITHCQDENIPEHIIQNWVGHEIGSKVTKSVYTHIQNETNLLYTNKLNNSKFYSDSTQILLTNFKE